MPRVTETKVLPSIFVDVAGQKIEVRLKRHAAARRFVLRLNRDGESFSLTVPPRYRQSAAESFIAKSQSWIENTLAHRGRKQAHAENAGLHLRGRPILIVPTGKMRGLVQFDEAQNTLNVPGEGAHQKRKIADWLKVQAEGDLKLACKQYADKMQVRYQRLTLRDQKSRWGSCTHDGVLNFSWRLIMAPPEVLDYVAAHEVAHLREMNHGPRFWRLVLSHCPHTRMAKQWLKQNGHRLHHMV